MDCSAGYHHVHGQCKSRGRALFQKIRSHGREAMDWIGDKSENQTHSHRAEMSKTVAPDLDIQ